MNYMQWLKISSTNKKSHPSCEEINDPDSVSAVLETLNIHQAPFIARGFVLFRVKAPHHTDGRHCFVHSIVCFSHRVLHRDGQPLRMESFFSCWYKQN